MKVIVVSFSFSRGGAALAAKKFSRVANNYFDIDMVQADSGGDIKGGARSVDGIRCFWHFFKRIISLSLLKLMYDRNPVKHSLNIFSSSGVVKKIKNVSGEEVINLHWVNNDTLSVFRFSRLPKNTVVTLHDEWLYCGAEHCYSINDSMNKFATKYKFWDRDVIGINWNYLIWRVKLRALNCRDDIIYTVPSSWMLERAKKSVILKGKDVRLLPNPIPTDGFFPLSFKESSRVRKRMGVKETDILLCFGATPQPGNSLKGFDLLDKALAYLCQLGEDEVLSNVHLLLFGHGERCEDNLHGFRLLNLGRVARQEDMRDIYAASDITLVPSMVESFGQVAAESLACGTPVVSFRTSGLTDIVKDRENGLLAEPFCEISYATCIFKLLKMGRKERQEMGLMGRRYVVESFSESVVGDKYHKIINDAVSCRL